MIVANGLLTGASTDKTLLKRTPKKDIAIAISNADPTSSFTTPPRYKEKRE
ncbi:unnamed protein product [marine sediment metagenome]|uniref:Uncharacterized protein n=1 Tax=marine sediment metagenome TaxID=412755 RepID=X1B4L0_9ZZZZ